MFDDIIRQKRKFLAYWISLILMVACKEDIAIYGMAVGIAAFFLPGKKTEERMAYRKVGLATFLFCLIYGVLAFKYLIPYFHGEGQYLPYRHFAWLGNNVKEIIVNNILHPGTVLKVLFSADRLNSICITFLPVLLLPLLGGVTFLPIIPSLGILLLSSSHYEYRLVMHYPASIPPFVIIAAIYGAYRLIRFPGWFSNPESKLSNLFGRRNGLCLIGSALIISCAMYSYYFGLLPFSKDFDSRKNTFHGPCERDFNPKNPRNIRVAPQNKAIMEFIKMIPNSASVCSQRRVMPHLGHKARLITFEGYNNTVRGPDRADYILLNTEWDRHPAIVRLLYEGEYGVRGYKEHVLLLKSNYSTGLNEWAYKQMFITFNARYLYSSFGSLVTDPEASTGYARFAAPPRDTPTKAAFIHSVNCVQGKHTIGFILKTDGLIPDKIAVLQAILPREKILVAEREIKGTDFRKADKYQSFSLDFNLSEDKKIQFRVIYIGKANLWIDSIQIKSRVMSFGEAYRRMVE